MPSLLLVVTRYLAVFTRHGRQIRGRIGDGLQSGLLLHRDRDHRWQRAGSAGGFIPQRHRAVDHQNILHLLVEVRIALFQIVFDPLWIQRLRRQFETLVRA